MSDRTMVSAEVAQALRWAAARLTAAGVDSPQWDAEQLAAHVLGTKKSELPRHFELDAAQHSEFVDLVIRRASRIPLQHLTGSVGFRHLELAVGAGVFIPRPETEVVAGFAIDALNAAGLPGPVVVELCAGSAAIALSIAQEVRGAQVHAVELDEQALEWARRNADARVRAGDPAVRLHHGEARGALPALDGRVDCVVANPPYVAEHELDEVDPEVRDHDPRHALVAGPDGLDVIHDVVVTAARLLRPGGLLVIEHSDRQAETAPAVLAGASGWRDIADHPDLTGRPRFVTALREDLRA